MPRTLLILLALSPWAAADEPSDFFEAKIRPVLAGTCFRCHGGTKTSGALRVDAREALLQGGDSGPAIVPGKPEQSLLVQAIRRLDGVSAMPPEKEKALRADQVADFVTWIQAGAVWPAKTERFAATKHWAFEPVKDVAVPPVKDAGWGRSSIDAFVRAKQEAAGIRPAPAADKRTLLRRATFDLTGLPPTPDEVEAFLRDESPRAFEAVIDRLLKSPAYGERWGRHWLDVVRYADTAGETADYPTPLAWRYRNYVLDAFRTDKPYDEFLREQIAGDVLADDGPPARYAERVTATGYLAISRRFGFDSENYHHLTIQDTIDTLGQTVLGLSLGCCRCHDHKFDPLTMRDYYALYGIFDSTRYPFPGSEQKQKVRSLVPLLPPEASQARWREFDARVGTLAGVLARQKQPLPNVVLRSLHDLDGDFELQAPAAGGSKGVLVPPWLYEGRIAVTNAAQSPFRNVYPLGRVGINVTADTGAYRLTQAIHPRRPGNTAPEGSRPAADLLFVNLDFRVGPGSGSHRFLLGPLSGPAAVEIEISSTAIGLRNGDQVETLRSLGPNQWHNVQLVLDRKSRTLAGRVGVPGSVAEFAGKPLSPGAIERVTLEAAVRREPPGLASPNVESPDGSRRAATTIPPIEFDNLAVQDAPLAPVSTDLAPASQPDAAKAEQLAAQLRTLTGLDGDFELQTKDSPPAHPWNPGPNSVVKLAAGSQSPFRNLYPPGELGVSMPNRGEYDGFGLTFPPAKPDKDGRLYVGFDFRCANRVAGGNGSWRYYLGHGPGQSAAIELFFNGGELFRRSANAKEPVGPLAIGEWHQVQLTLDLPKKTYTGTLTSSRGKLDFSGQLASGWDGTLDYSFIDSYGHVGGVRPSLDADNFAIRDQPLPPFDAPPVAAPPVPHRENVAELRRQLATLQGNASRTQQELNALLAAGPFDLAYGMAEGTPHNVRLQQRGEPDQLGEEIPRGFVGMLGGGSLPADAPGSGRLELARWLTRPDNPLTARVMVNRVWHQHFGRGLVRTPNDFGLRGQPPTHPELLDHLATEFVRGGWSIKSLHRRIMLSATYQQAAVAEVSPHYAGFPRRRLSAEEIRDAILFVSGELDPTPGREHPFPAPLSWGFTQHAPFSAVYDHHRRSVYLMTPRLKRHPYLALFDGPDPNATTADRLTTTVPTQALFFLNDPFVHAAADKWSERLQAASPEPSAWIERAYRQTLGRPPSTAESTDATEFLAAYRSELAAAKLDNPERRSLAAFLRTLLGSNEFLHVE